MILRITLVQGGVLRYDLPCIAPLRLLRDASYLRIRSRLESMLESALDLRRIPKTLASSLVSGWSVCEILEPNFYMVAEHGSTTTSEKYDFPTTRRRSRTF